MDMCCICEELRWKDAPPLEIVYTDERADKYCIFHAPKDHKGVDDREFERRVHDRIRRGAEGKIAADGSPVSNLCGTVFPGEVWFERANHGGLPRIYLEYAEFWGRARFKGITFDGAVDCSHAIFHTDVDFSKSTFSGAAIFDGAKFHGAATFSDTVCNGQASFIGCTFKKVATFISTHFKGKCQFTEATFYDFAAFQLSVFENDIDYIHATFKKSAYFHEMRISKQLLFSACASQDHGIKIHKVSKHSLENLILNPGDLQQFSFWCCDWPAKLYQEIKQENSTQAFQACEELYRAMKQRAAEEHDQPQVSHWHYREKLMQLKKLLLPTNCKALIEAVEDSTLCKGSQVRAWWELFRALPWRLRVSLLFLYWTSSGFGERAKRAAACLAALVLFPIFILLPLKLAETGLSLTPDTQKVAEVLLEWLRCMPFAKLDAPTSPPPTILSAARTILSYAFQLLIILQFTLFALAVRNRFRR